MVRPTSTTKALFLERIRRLHISLRIQTAQSPFEFHHGRFRCKKHCSLLATLPFISRIISDFAASFSLRIKQVFRFLNQKGAQVLKSHSSATLRSNQLLLPRFWHLGHYFCDFMISFRYVVDLQRIIFTEVFQGFQSIAYLERKKDQPGAVVNRISSPKFQVI